MKSLILTVLYLIKDTVNRWFTRVSSPLARVLVVFFLSLCALCFLGSYVISAKVIRDRIIREGGDLVHAVIFPAQDKSVFIPDAAELEQALDADSLELQSLGRVMLGTRRSVPLYTYDFRRSAQMYPLLAGEGAPTLLCKEGEGYTPGPLDVRLGGMADSITVAVRYLPAEHPLLRLINQGAVLVSPDTAQRFREARGANAASFSTVTHLLLRVRNPQSAADLDRCEALLTTLLRLEGANGSVTSASRLLREMDVVLGNQTQCRATFCLGIVAIVGILLTALAGMEYRQNEYIYTLMKSFGIHPFLLVFTFLAENAVLVGLSFAAAIQVFMSCQVIIVRQFFKTAEYTLTLDEILPEIRLIAAALALCIAVSSLPVLVAAHREIGRVLK